MKIEIKKGKDLPEEIFRFIRKARFTEYGEHNTKFQKRDQDKTVFFFAKEDDMIVAMGALYPIKVNFNEKTYHIFGIGGILSIVKKKGYGKVIIKEIIKYLKKTRKTGLGFCGRKNKIFYEKVGLKYENLLGKRFALKNPKTGKIKFEAPDDVGDGIYYEGKDKFITQVLKTKSVGYYWLPRIGDPHW
jgi:hypothetical protein